MAKHSVEHLIKMLNQIAQSVPAATPETRAAAAAEHIDKFWTPTMKRQIVDWAVKDGDGLSSFALSAIEKLQIN